MKKKRIGIILGLVVLGIISISLGISQPKFDGKKIKARLLQDVPALKNASSDLEKANLLRNHVFSNTQVNPSPWGGFLTLDDYESWKKGDTPLLCGGMSVMYLNFLKSFGLEGRYVGFVTDDTFQNNGSNDTHVATEVKINGKWVLQDPTFNIRWEHNGNPLGAMEFRNLIQGKVKPESITDGFSIPAKRSLEKYPIGFDKLSEVMYIADYPLTGKYAGNLFYLDAAPYPVNEFFSLFQATPLSIAPPKKGIPEKTWVFSNEIPSDVSITSEAKTQLLPDRKGLKLKTGFASGKTHLVTEEIELKAGKYALFILGEIQEGGINLWVRGKNIQGLITSGLFWWKQFKGNHPPFMKVSFKLKEKTKVEIRVLNLALERKASVWVLTKMELWKEP